MTVTPRCTDLFQSRRELHQFLSVSKQVAQAKKQPQIVSLSVETSAVDPLVVFQLLAAKQLHFYFERSFGEELDPGNGMAIAAIGAAAQLTLNGAERFAIAQQFIQSTLAQTVICGQAHRPFAGPHFFCSFAFDQDDQQTPFPAATVFLPEWQISRQGPHCFIVANVAIDAATALEPTVDHVWRTWQAIRSIRYELLTPAIDQRELLKIRDVADTQHFKQAVRSALLGIQQATSVKLCWLMR